MQTHRHKLSAVLFCCLPLLFSLSVWGQDISIKYASGRAKGPMYLIDANLNLELDEKIISALQHGVSLDFDVDLQIRRERKWLWDKLIMESTITYQLEHHPLSDDYVVTNINDGAREQFQTLDEALHYLGTIRDYPAIEADKLSPDAVYIGLIRAELNIEELPPPLQPIAFVSSEWHLESQWYEWIIR